MENPLSQDKKEIHWPPSKKQVPRMDLGLPGESGEGGEEHHHSQFLFCVDVLPRGKAYQWILCMRY